MKKPDDCTLTPSELARVRKQARIVLEKADAIGCFPTPVSEIMRAAQVTEVKEDVLNPSFITKIRKEVAEFGSSIRQALTKVLGLFDARSRLVFIDRSIHIVKQTFIRLHETAHGFLPWQKDLYVVVEDCKKTLDPHVADLFDRQANVFASEVLFQLDAFAEESFEQEFTIFTPVNLSKKYGASIYSSIRQYVSKNPRTCTVIVLNPPEPQEGIGYYCTLRRVISSPSFEEKFKGIKWPDVLTPDSKIGAMIPTGKQRSSGKQEIELIDTNGNSHICIAEAFTQTWQVFILIHSVKTLTQSSVLIAAG